MTYLYLVLAVHEVPRNSIYIYMYILCIHIPVIYRCIKSVAVHCKTSDSIAVSRRALL